MYAFGNNTTFSNLMHRGNRSLCGGLILCNRCVINNIAPENQAFPEPDSRLCRAAFFQ
jgi:hypothetical protein